MRRIAYPAACLLARRLIDFTPASPIFNRGDNLAADFSTLTWLTFRAAQEAAKK